MIENVMAYCNNFFSLPDSHYGTWTVEDGSILLPFLADGQYFRVIGSIFNDGVYTYPAQLKDETFAGHIVPLAPPKAFLDLCEQISEYEATSHISPYTAESFGGYSYQKAAGKGGGGLSWQEAYTVQLRRWRKI
jgi:hypothetical protein